MQTFHYLSNSVIVMEPAVNQISISPSFHKTLNPIFASKPETPFLMNFHTYVVLLQFEKSSKNGQILAKNEEQQPC